MSFRREFARPKSVSMRALEKAPLRRLINAPKRIRYFSLKGGVSELNSLSVSLKAPLSLVTGANVLIQKAVACPRKTRGAGGKNLAPCLSTLQNGQKRGAGEKIYIASLSWRKFFQNPPSGPLHTHIPSSMYTVHTGVRDIERQRQTFSVHFFAEQ